MSTVVESPKFLEGLEPPKSEFVAKLENRWAQGKFVCVGLDSDYLQIPQGIRDRARKYTFNVFTSKEDREEVIFRFNEEIIDATADLVSAYKPNAGFYEEHKDEGTLALERTIKYIKANYNDIPVIYDAKRADIGNTNNGYVKSAFDELGADAITVHSYHGNEAMKPFLDRGDKGILVVARTSNPGAGELQDLPVDLTKLSDEYKSRFGDMEELRELTGSDIVPYYLATAFRVSRYWNQNGNVGLVVGATYPRELAEVRAIVGDMPILIPGIGAQGGEVEATITAGKDSRGWGMIVNSSRGIIFAYKEAMKQDANFKETDFALAARSATEKLHDQINQYI